VNLRLQPALKAAEKAAADDHRSLSSLIEKLLADHLRTQPSLTDWHERALTRLAVAAADIKSDQTKLGTLARSYCIKTSNSDKLSSPDMVSIINHAHSSLRTAIPNPHIFCLLEHTGASPIFYV
jgi:hypothetical protein